MKQQLDRVETKLDKLHEALHTHALHTAQRVTKLETAQKGVITLITLFFTTIIGIMVKMYQTI